MFSILYVDDEPGLLEIGKLFLEQGGQFKVETITSAAEALEILRTGHYDAIISDYQMPVIDGIEFLKRVRASGNTVPFIIFTGRGREEIVIQAFNEGADFYLQKGGEPLSQFAELGHKVQKAILQRRAEASVRDHERREADIINFLPDATFAIDTRGVVIAWNRAMERMTGVPADQILGKGNYEYAIPFYHERRPVLIDLVLPDNLSIDARYPFIKREGKNLVSEITIPHFNEGRGAALWFTASLLYDTGGNIVGAIESIRDITESKRAEEAKNESERRFRELADMLPQAIYEADLQGNLTYANRIAFEIFGYTEEDIKKGMSVVSTISPGDRERAAAALRHVTNGESRPQASIEYTAQRKDGSTFPVSIYSSSIIRDGRIAGLRGIIVDITERKRAEESLRESEGRFSAFMEHLPVTAFIKDEHFTNLFVNRHMEELFGAQGWIGKTVRELFPPDAAEKMIADDRLALGEGYRKTIENLVETNGDRRIFETHKFRIDRENKPPLLGGFAIDITEQQNTVAFLNSLIDQSPTPMWISDETGMLIRINRACCALLQVTEEEMLGKYSIFDDNIVKEQGFLPRVRDVFEKGEVAQFPLIYETTRLKNLDLKQFVSVILDVTIFPVRDNLGKITHAVIQHTDITRRRDAEEALRESEQKYRTVFETTGTATVLIENDGVISLANSEFEHLSGYAKDEIETRKKWAEFVVQEDLDRMLVQHDLRRENHERALTHYEFRFRTRSGEVRDIFLTIDVIPGTGKSVASLLDITERKRVENSLVIANQEYTNLLDQIQDVYYRSDAEGRLVKASRSLAVLLGYHDLAECLGRNISDDFYANPADRKLFMDELYRNGQVTNYDVELKKKDGSSIIVATSSHLYYDTSGKVLGVEGTFRDITERKKAEIALQVAREKYAKAFHSVSDAMTISEQDSGRFIEVNEAATKLFGFSREELMGKSAAELGIWLNSEDRAAFMDRLKRDGRIQEYEVIEKRKSGEQYNAVINADTLIIGDRKYLISVIRDITERKRAEQVIREAHRKINLLTSITRHDVTNQVAVLRGFTRIALMKKPDPVISDLLQKIDSAVSAIARQIEFTRAYQELGMQTPGWQKVRDIMAQQKAEGVSLSCTCDAEVYADPMLERVFYNLIDNAIRHGETVTAITVSCRPDPDGLVIVVGDNGIGVPHNLKDTIFEKGYGKNTGFGLFLAREILAITGIIIIETGTYRNGAQFEIIVPKGMYRVPS
jgi:PAS domain S-box-containing protein